MIAISVRFRILIDDTLLENVNEFPTKGNSGLDEEQKKTDRPSINPDNYGTQFMVWWKEMQPEWRNKMDRDSSGTLKQDTPADENWQALKKRGSAGMYIAVMGLSWWVKAQTTVSDHGNNAWTAVADLLWVFHQINNINS